jgi:uncharacterized protein (DUF1697 family)
MGTAKTAKGGVGVDAYAALLRGINLGGRQLPMKELVAMFERAGCTNVRSYIQSGNVVFRAQQKIAAGISAVVEKAIRTRFKYDAPIVLRSASELATVARKNPFLAAGADPKSLHVAFLAAIPPSASVAVLDPKRSPGDEFVVKGRDVYLRLPNGVGKSKLTNAYFDSKLGTTSTIRNWATVLKLLEMARE